MIRRQLCAFALGGILALTVTAARADDSALLDLLLKKGILTQKEVEKLEAKISEEPAPVQRSGLESKLKIGSWVEELDLNGEIRFRENWQSFEQQLPPTGKGGFDKVIQRQRLRFRLRLDANFKLVDNIFGSVELVTSDNRNGNTTNATYTSGFDNYNIYIRKAFIGWAPTDGLTFVIGKQNIPFYTSELNWSPDAKPAGLVERIDFHTLFGWGSGGEPPGYSKEGKSPLPARQGPSFELSLIAGQFTFFNNNADSSLSFNKTDAFMFETQLLGRLKLFGGKLAIAAAPAVQIWNEAGLGPTTVLPDGKPNPASVTGTGTGALGTLNIDNPFPMTTRDEFYIQTPGYMAFKLAGIPLLIYADTSYNVWGPRRFTDVYGPLFSRVRYVGTTPVFFDVVRPSFRDYFAWLVGFQIGQNRKPGDISLLVDYRQLGIASADPNIKSDDFNQSFLNAAGWRVRIAYNITDFAAFQVTGWFANNLSRNLFGGFATSPSLFPIANANSSEFITADLVFKF